METYNSIPAKCRFTEKISLWHPHSSKTTIHYPLCPFSHNNDHYNWEWQQRWLDAYVVSEWKTKTLFSGPSASQSGRTETERMQAASTGEQKAPLSPRTASWDCWERRKLAQKHFPFVFVHVARSHLTFHVFPVRLSMENDGRGGCCWAGSGRKGQAFSGWHQSANKGDCCWLMAGVFSLYAGRKCAHTHTQMRK